MTDTTSVEIEGTLQNYKTNEAAAIGIAQGDPKQKKYPYFAYNI